MLKNGYVLLLVIGLLTCTFIAPAGLGRFDAPDGTSGTRGTLVVGPTGTYATIKAGIENATSGDTVQVLAGTYNEFVIIPIDKTIHLEGAGADLTTVMGSAGYMSTITIDSPGSSVKGLKVKGGGTGSGNAGIFIRSLGNTVEDCVIDSNGGTGVFLSGANGNHIKSCQMTNNALSGICLDNSDNNILENLTVSGNSGDGIYVNASQSNQFNDLVISDNDMAGMSLHDSDTNSVTRCVSDGNTRDGLFLMSSDGISVRGCNLTGNKMSGVGAFSCSYLSLQGCNVLTNEGDGVYMNGSSGNTLQGLVVSQNLHSGISLSLSDTNIVRSCVLLADGYSSINLVGSSTNTITQNTFKDSPNFGLQMDPGSGLNAVYQNAFLGNKPGDRQSVDDGTGNVWSKDGFGNYWSDWTWPDANGDGIIDNPYGLYGTGKRYDEYPLSAIWGRPNIYTDDVWHSWEDTGYEVPYGATDLNTTQDDLVWTMATNASWLTFDSEQVLAGTPLQEDIGSYFVNVTVGDGTYLCSHNFTVYVWNVNDPPVITTKDVTVGKQGETYSVDYAATDPDLTDDHLTWHLHTNGWGFLSFDQGTGLLSGTPGNDDVGKYFVNIWVDDGHGAWDETNFTLTIANVNDPPQIRYGIWDLGFDEDASDSSITMDWWFKDVDGDSLTYRWEGNDKINVSISAGVRVTLTPPPDWSGSENITFIASDGASEVSDDVLITVRPVNDAPMGLRMVLEDRPYIAGGQQPAKAEATDADLLYGDSLTYTWTSNLTGEIGKGETVNLSLTPGHHLVTLRASDESGAWTETSVELTIDEPKSEETSKGGSLTDYWWIFLMIILVLLLIAAIAVFLVARKRKEAKEGAAGGPSSDTLPDPQMNAPPAAMAPQQPGAYQSAGPMQQVDPQTGVQAMPQGAAAYPQSPQPYDAGPPGGAAPIELGSWPMDQTQNPQLPPAQVQCYSCHSMITMTSGERPMLLTCPVCGTQSQIS